MGSVGRRRVFAVLTTLLPVLLLAAVEGGLRLGGFGESHPLFVPVDEAPGYLQANPGLVRRFVAGGDTPNLWIRPVPFERPKDPETFRIVVQGGSTAAGYPYGYGASPAGLLQQRLQRTFPGRRVQVITTAMSALNSYALLDSVDEILEQDPDLVVIYAGHNEYLGLLGVASTFSAGRSRPAVLAFLHLRELRLLQLARRAVATLSTGHEPARDPSRRTLMSRVVAEDRIPLGSELYRRGLEQWRANLRALLTRYRQAGVPVWIGTVVSNERDQPPFVSGLRQGVDEAGFNRQLATARRALEAGEPLDALGATGRALELDDGHAEAHYLRARALDALGRLDEARQAYHRAKELDQLRFRAPEAINTILRDVAGDTGARVVEVRRAFVEAARDGMVGRDLMLEHLHPNLDGYFLLADAFYDALHEDGAMGPWPRSVPESRARRELPVTEVDRLYGEYRIAKLTAGWPFRQEAEPFELPQAETTVEVIAQSYYRGRYGWPEAMRQLLHHYRYVRDTEEAARVAVLVAEAFPYRSEAQLTAAKLLQAVGRDDARVYLQRARAAPR